MSLARYKDLCLDAANPRVLGEFWSAALGLDLHTQNNGDASLTGPSSAHTIWINGVAEPKATKHRVHLDVHGSSVANLRELGASVIDGDSFAWTVMADPEGGEFCLFVTDEPPAYRLYEIAIDCADHEALSRWWASTIGGRHVVDDGGFSYVTDIPDAPFDSISFGAVDEAKTSKNRVHIDVVCNDVEALVRSGAVLLRARDSEIDWDVLADPEGNEFCVFTTH